MPEIWRFDGKNLRILIRQQDGSYREADESKALPWITIEELRRFADEADSRNDTLWAKSFRKWVQESIVPRMQGDHGLGSQA